MLLLLNISFQQWDIKAYLEKQANVTEIFNKQLQTFDKNLEKQTLIIDRQQQKIEDILEQQIKIMQKLHKVNTYSTPSNTNTFNRFDSSYQDNHLTLMVVDKESAMFRYQEEIFTLHLQQTWGRFTLIELGRDFAVLIDDFGEKITLTY